MRVPLIGSNTYIFNEFAWAVTKFGNDAYGYAPLSLSCEHDCPFEFIFEFGRGRVMYAHVERSHPVGVKDDSVTGWTCLVDTDRVLPVDAEVFA